MQRLVEAMDLVKELDDVTRGLVASREKEFLLRIEVWLQSKRGGELVTRVVLNNHALQEKLTNMERDLIDLKKQMEELTRENKRMRDESLVVKSLFSPQLFQVGEGGMKTPNGSPQKRLKATNRSIGELTPGTLMEMTEMLEEGEGSSLKHSNIV